MSFFKKSPTGLHMQPFYSEWSAHYRDVVEFHSDTEREVDFLDWIFQNNKVKNVFDVACGIGRHSILLAQRGYSVTGIDYSPYQIRQAKKEARKKSLKSVKFLIEDANKYVSRKKFDAAICMWSTLGEEPMQYPKVIRNVFHSLKPKGIFVIDNSSWEKIPKSREQYKKYDYRSNNIPVIQECHDRFTDHFRIRDVITTIIEGRRRLKFKDLCVTHTLKTKDWIEAFKAGNFKSFKIYHDYAKKHLRKPDRVIIVAYRSHHKA